MKKGILLQKLQTKKDEQLYKHKFDSLGEIDNFSKSKNYCDSHNMKYKI